MFGASAEAKIRSVLPQLTIWSYRIAGGRNPIFFGLQRKKKKCKTRKSQNISSNLCIRIYLLHASVWQSVAASILFVVSVDFGQNNWMIRSGMSLTWAFVHPWHSSTGPCLPSCNMTFGVQIVWPFEKAGLSSSGRQERQNSLSDNCSILNYGTALNWEFPALKMSVVRWKISSGLQGLCRWFDAGLCHAWQGGARPTKSACDDQTRALTLRAKPSDCPIMKALSNNNHPQQAC